MAARFFLGAGERRRLKQVSLEPSEEAELWPEKQQNLRIKSPIKARIADLQQMLLAQCEFVIRQTEIVAARSKMLSQSLREDGGVSGTNPLPSLPDSKSKQFASHCLFVEEEFL